MKRTSSANLNGTVNKMTDPNLEQYEPPVVVVASKSDIFQCFFCLQSVKFKRSGENRVFKSQLYNICQYLGVNLGIGGVEGEEANHLKDPLTIKSIVEGEEEEVARKGGIGVSNVNFPVLFCNNCENTAGALAGYCEKLEVTKMCIDQFLKKITDIFTRTGSASEKYRKPEGKEILEFRRMRNLTKAKCLSKLPRKEGACAPASMGEDDHFDQSSCPFCDESLMNSEELNFHTISVHPEQLLWSAKTPSASDTEFRTLCLELLKKKSDVVPIQNRKLTCLYCPATHQDKKQLLSHLMDTHLYILTRKLEKLQETKSKPGNNGMNGKKKKLIATKTTSKSGPNSKPKPETGINGKKQKLIVTKSTSKIESDSKQNSKPEDNDPSSSTKKPKKVCPYCKKKFNQKKNLKKHILFIHHRESFTVKIPDSNNPSTSNSSSSTTSNKAVGKGVKKPCEKCGKLVSKHNLPRHVEIHCPQRKPKIPENNTNSEKPPQTKKKTGKTTLPMDMISWECINCGRLFATTEGLEQHTRRGCREDKKKDDIKVETSSEANVAIIPVTSTTTATTTTTVDEYRKFKCSLCEASYVHLPSLQRHQRQCGKPKMETQIYPCPNCDRKYTSTFTRNRHMRKSCQGNEGVKAGVSGQDQGQESSVTIANTFSLAESEHNIDEQVYLEIEENDIELVVPKNEATEIFYEEEHDVLMMVPENDPLQM